MKKLLIVFTMLFMCSFVYAEEVSEKVAEENANKNEEVKENAEKAQKELKKEVAPEEAEEKAEEAEEKAEKVEEAGKEEEEIKEKEEEAKEEPEESQRTFKAEKTKIEQQPVYLEEFKPEKEITKKWYFIPIEIGLGTSLQVGLTVAQLTHKNFEIKIARMMLGPGFTFGSEVDEDQGFVPGLTFLGEVAIGKFFGNPLKESCFGITLGIGSKVIFDIRNIDDEERWEDGVDLDDTLYIDFLPIYFTYRWKKGDKFYDLSLRIPLVWQNGVYVVTDETKLYNGVPDLSLNFSFAF